MIFPPNYTSSKVDVEKKKTLAAYFQNLFVWDRHYLINYTIDLKLKEFEN